MPSVVLAFGNDSTFDNGHVFTFGCVLVEKFSVVAFVFCWHSGVAEVETLTAERIRGDFGLDRKSVV